MVPPGPAIPLLALALACSLAVAGDAAFTHAPTIEVADDGAPTAPPRHLFATRDCPIDPKPACDDPACQGVITMATGTAFERYTCTNLSPAHLPGRPPHVASPVVLARCRCCPPFAVPCTDANCAAAPGTATCLAEPLRACACESPEGPPPELPAAEPQARPPGPYLQPNIPPVHSGEVMMRLLRQAHGMGLHITRNETELQRLERAGIARPPGAAPRENAIAAQGVIRQHDMIQHDIQEDGVPQQGNASSGDGASHGGPAPTLTVASWLAVWSAAGGGSNFASG